MSNLYGIWLTCYVILQTFWRPWPNEDGGGYIAKLGFQFSSFERNHEFNTAVDVVTIFDFSIEFFIQSKDIEWFEMLKQELETATTTNQSILYSISAFM